MFQLNLENEIDEKINIFIDRHQQYFLDKKDIKRFIGVMSNPRISDNNKETILVERNINFSFNLINNDKLKKELILFIDDIKIKKQAIF
jgi:hypothetical protein